MAKCHEMWNCDAKMHGLRFDNQWEIVYNIWNMSSNTAFIINNGSGTASECLRGNRTLNKSWRKVFRMAAEKKNILTYEGLKRLEEELQDLKVNQRREVAQKIKEAREQGDLSENAEYDAAKDEQRDIEARIEEIDKILKNAEVVVEDEVALDTISIGCCVTIMDLEYEDTMEFKIVGSTEANSLKGTISNESPLGRTLMGHKMGEIVEVESPSGMIGYKILDITRSN